MPWDSEVGPQPYLAMVVLAKLPNASDTLAYGWGGSILGMSLQRQKCLSPTGELSHCSK
jgi:hypothetical protein